MKLKKRHLEVKRIASTDQTRANLNSVHFRQEPKQFSLEATNGRMAIRLIFSEDEEGKAERSSTILKTKDVTTLHRTMSNTDEVDIFCYGQDTPTKIRSDMLDHKITPVQTLFPNLNQITPNLEEQGQAIWVDPNYLIELLTAMTKTMNIKKNDARVVRLSFQKATAVENVVNDFGMAMNPMLLEIREFKDRYGGSGGCRVEGILMPIRPDTEED